MLNASFHRSFPPSLLLPGKRMSGWRVLPGSIIRGGNGSTFCAEYRNQICQKMKLQRKSNVPVAAALHNGMVATVVNLDDTTGAVQFQPPYLATCGNPSEPFDASDPSPLRALLISRLPRHKAPSSLVQRIQSALNSDDI
jgi:hypothetical protein